MSSEENDEKNAELREFLYENAKRGKWEAVVEKYAKYPRARGLKLTHKEETALHLAVIDNQEAIVETLVELIRNSKSTDYKKILSITNERKNNPLHLAAVMGSVRMCQALASAHHELLDMRNKVDETPMFLAVAYGHKNAFYCLYFFCGSSNLDRISTNCREKYNGDTVLHYALRNDQFDLAFQLIHLNNKAMDWVNEDGCTALHVLATKPTAFKSGTHITGWQNIVYYCTYVAQLKPQPIETLKEQWKKGMRPEANNIRTSFPLNYHTCIEFFMILWDAFLKVSTLKRLLKKCKNSRDSEKDVKMENGNVEIHGSGASDASIIQFPENYVTCINIFQFVFTAIMIILGFGSSKIRKIREKKQKHSWSVQVMEKILDYNSRDEYEYNGKMPMDSKIHTDEDDGITHPYSLVDEEVHFSSAVGMDTNIPKQDSELPKHVMAQTESTAMLIAAKHGVIEIVKGICKRFPLAIHDTRKEDRKNVVHLAAEYRQPEIYKFLLKEKHHNQSLFRAVDVNGNSALHLAAAAPNSMIWRINGATLQMQWEVQWYKFIEESMPLHFFAHYNKKGKTAITMFHETHMELVKNSGEWLTKTSKSCSVVGTLIMTVAFTSATSIPGGFNKNNGAPLLEKDQCFFIFAITSLIALCLSSTSVTTFLAILTYRFDANDFRSNLPSKLFIGFSSLFFSIVSMLISFCAAHYYLVDYRLKNVAVLLYTIIFLPVTFIFLISKLPLYFDTLKTIFKIVPRRSANVVLSNSNSNSRPLSSKGKFEVASVPVDVKLSDKNDAVSLLIFTPTTQSSYPVIFFLPGCVPSLHSNLLKLIASQGVVIVAPKLNVMPTRSEMEKTSWVEEMVEEKLSKLVVVGEGEGENDEIGSKGGEITKLSLGFGYDTPSHSFSKMIGFHVVPATKFSVPFSQFQTHAPQSSFHISTSNLEAQFVISKLSGNVKSLCSTQDSS